MASIPELLNGHITLEVECLDRLYLNGYIGNLVTGPQLCYFMREQLGKPVPSPVVQGIGGLGHLGVQFAKKFGYRVVAIGRGSDNAALAKKLGADAYIDSAATDPAGELQKLGGASVILATAPSGKAMSSL